MKGSALHRAEASYERAERYAADLEAADSFDAARDAWIEILIHGHRVASQLAAGGSGPSAAWWGRKSKARKDDPLLQYLHQARHSDEHGIEDVTALRRGGISYSAADGSKPVRIIARVDGGGVPHLLGGENVRTTRHKPGARLIAVTNVGRRYDPPPADPKVPWEPIRAEDAARTYLSFLASCIDEARAYVVD